MSYVGVRKEFKFGLGSFLPISAFFEGNQRIGAPPPASLVVTSV